jgi:hypothetical protein
MTARAPSRVLVWQWGRFGGTPRFASLLAEGLREIAPQSRQNVPAFATKVPLIMTVLSPGSHFSTPTGTNPSAQVAANGVAAKGIADKARRGAAVMTPIKAKISPWELAAYGRHSIRAIHDNYREFIMQFLKLIVFATLAGLPLTLSPAMAATTDGTITDTNPQTGTTTTVNSNGSTITRLPNGAPVTPDGTTYTQTGTKVTPTATQPGANAGSGK